MDDGELDTSKQVIKSMEHQFSSSCAMDSLFDYMLDDTHAHTRTNTSNQSEQDMSQNPVLPQSPNYNHFLTQNPPVEEKTTTEETDESYRERKKARQASIEDELIRMRIVNQQLLKRVQGLVALEQEVERFKCLLVKIRGRIKGELGSFPFQKPANDIGFIPQKNSRPSTLVGAYDVKSVPQ
ncbi:hypothetical protein MKW92_005432 [Papaver armeniacum]|nr:hypothetical protein MKW92_005432 [Papaver armeniacum]